MNNDLRKKAGIVMFTKLIAVIDNAFKKRIDEKKIKDPISRAVIQTLVAKKFELWEGGSIEAWKPQKDTAEHTLKPILQSLGHSGIENALDVPESTSYFHRKNLLDYDLKRVEKGMEPKYWDILEHAISGNDSDPARMKDLIALNIACLDKGMEAHSLVLIKNWINKATNPNNFSSDIFHYFPCLSDFDAALIAHNKAPISKQIFDKILQNKATHIELSPSALIAWATVESASIRNGDTENIEEQTLNFYLNYMGKNSEYHRRAALQGLAMIEAARIQQGKSPLYSNKINELIRIEKNPYALEGLMDLLTKIDIQLIEKNKKPYFINQFLNYAKNASHEGNNTNIEQIQTEYAKRMQEALTAIETVNNHLISKGKKDFWQKQKAEIDNFLIDEINQWDLSKAKTDKAIDDKLDVLTKFSITYFKIFSQWPAAIDKLTATMDFDGFHKEKYLMHINARKDLDNALIESGQAARHIPLSLYAVSKYTYEKPGPQSSEDHKFFYNNPNEFFKLLAESDVATIRRGEAPRYLDVISFIFMEESYTLKLWENKSFATISAAQQALTGIYIALAEQGKTVPSIQPFFDALKNDNLHGNYSSTFWSALVENVNKIYAAALKANQILMPFEQFMETGKASSRYEAMPFELFLTPVFVTAIEKGWVSENDFDHYLNWSYQPDIPEIFQKHFINIFIDSNKKPEALWEELKQKSNLWSAAELPLALDTYIPDYLESRSPARYIAELQIKFAELIENERLQAARATGREAYVFTHSRDVGIHSDYRLTTSKVNNTETPFGVYRPFTEEKLPVTFITHDNIPEWWHWGNQEDKLLKLAGELRTIIITTNNGDDKNEALKKEILNYVQAALPTDGTATTTADTHINTLHKGLVYKDDLAGFHADYYLFSPSMKDKKNVGVFMPPNIKPGDKLPVILLLHGVNSHWDIWNSQEEKLLKLAKEKNAIIITPDGDAEHCYVDGKEKKVKQYIIKELLPYVHDTLPTDGTNMIFGDSMGGFGVLNFAFNHPEKFKHAIAGSPVVDLSDSGTSNSLPNARILVGDNQTRQYKSLITSLNMNAAAIIAAGTDFTIFLGATEYLRPEITELHSRMLELKIPHRFITHVASMNRDDFLRAVPTRSAAAEKKLFSNPGSYYLTFKENAEQTIKDNAPYFDLFPYVRNGTGHEKQTFAISQLVAFRLMTIGDAALDGTNTNFKIVPGPNSTYSISYPQRKKEVPPLPMTTPIAKTKVLINAFFRTPS